MKYKFTINAKGRPEILLYGDIGQNYFGGGISSKEFVNELNDLGSVSDIDVRINSDGGSVFEGYTIYNALVRNPAKITVHIDSLAASIASIIAMAGDTINMSKNGWIMIHNPATMVDGEADDFRNVADLLDKIRGQMLDVYAARTGLAPDAISSMMSETKWMETVEAFELGFIDNVTDDLAIAAKLDIEKYPNAPSVLLNNAERATMRSNNKRDGAGVVSTMRERLKARNL